MNFPEKEVLILINNFLISEIKADFPILENEFWISENEFQISENKLWISENHLNSHIGK